MPAPGGMRGCETMHEWRLERMRGDRVRVRIKGLGIRYVPELDAEAAPVVAFINHGRWVGACDVCGSAEFVDPLEPTFWCLNCGNESVAGRLRPVVFPKGVEYIETVLSARPRWENRNWHPGESLLRLGRENRQHGMSLREVE